MLKNSVENLILKSVENSVGENMKIFNDRNIWQKNKNPQRNLFEILLNLTEIRLYLPFSDWFETANEHCPFVVSNQSENSKYNRIWG